MDADPLGKSLLDPGTFSPSLPLLTSTPSAAIVLVVRALFVIAALIRSAPRYAFARDRLMSPGTSEGGQAPVSHN